MSADGFHAFAEREVAVVTDCLASGKSMRQCARQNFYAAQQVIKGMYAAFAPDWLSVYPSAQLWWILMEEYMEAPTKHIQVPCARAPHVIPCSSICHTRHAGTRLPAHLITS